MSAPQFFVDPSAVGEGTATISGDEGHHLAKVLRAQPGMALVLADGAGRVFDATVTEVHGDAVEVRVDHERSVPQARPRIVVVHALPKARKLDDVVQKLSEVGVERIVPVHSARSEARLDPAKERKLVERWRAIALAAAKQSHRPRVMDVDPIGRWERSFLMGTTGVVLWEDERETPLRAALEGIEAGEVEELVLGIGPEGGLTEDEVRGTRLPSARLGEEILRTETAALVAVTATLTLLGRLG